jgi:hypothetical protein
MGKVKAATVVMLVAAAVIGGSRDWFTGSFLAIGSFNAVFSIPGTLWLRCVAVASTFAALLLPTDVVRALAVVFLWLIWPPATLVAWSVAREEDAADPTAFSVADPGARAARAAVAAIIAAVAVATVGYKVVFARELNQTAALFIGVPALLACVVILFVRTQTATGVACKAVTVGLLVSLAFLGEGMLCVVMAAPIFYAVAIGIGVAIDRVRRQFDEPSRTVYSSLIVLAIVPMALEGTHEWLSFNREEFVTATRVVDARAADVRRAVLLPPRFDREMPVHLLAGFPRPISVRIEDGTRWIVRMRGGEMRIDGMEPRAGDLVLDLTHVGTNSARWRAASDDSHMTHFLAWRASTVTWESIGEHATRVTWTIHYRRGLDPAWYFGPWERYVVRLAADYLITAVATP